MALLDTVADRREALLRQIYAVNRETIESGRKGDPAAILIPVDSQHDPHEALHLVDKLQMAGVDVSRASASFQADSQTYPAGTFVIPMTQVFARYAKDILEKQTYPEVRRAPNAPPEPPYDVTAWSLGMIVEAARVHRVERALDDVARPAVGVIAVQREGEVQGCGQRKLRRDAEAAVLVVKRRKDQIDQRVERRRVTGGDVTRSRLRRLRLLDLAGPRPHRVDHALEDARHLLGGHERATTQEIARGGQEGRGRPATEVVALVDVRAAIGVDANRNERLLHEGDDRRRGIRGAIHLVAGAAPGSRDREQDRLAFASSARERVRVPWHPRDGGFTPGIQGGTL